VLARLGRFVASVPATIVVGAVKLYQRLLSPLVNAMGPLCRFRPSCSQYMIDAVRKYGCVRGTAKGVARICRCHPWHPGGDDPA
jgi:putative membrane protein insertion efficiency factor